MNEPIDDIIGRLRDAIGQNDEMEIFNKDEVVAIRKIIKLVDMLESWGKLGKAALWSLSAIAAVLIAYDQIAMRIVGK